MAFSLKQLRSAFPFKSALLSIFWYSIVSLLIQEQSQDQRGSPTNFITPSEGQWVSSNRDARNSAQAPAGPPSVPPRAQTRPVQSETKGQLHTSPRKLDLKINTVEVSGDAKPDEICLSPSWSDHGDKKRRKERRQREREQKEREKKAKEFNGGKKDQKKNGGAKQESSDTKAGKRAGKKPPPAAMETQKMPSGLRRNSIVSLFSSRSRSSSREGSRRNSLAGDERRLSAFSISSFTSQRSQTTPPTSEESGENNIPYRKTVSSIAPRLPSFGWKPGRDSNDLSKSVAAWNHEAAYEKEVVGFAYRLDATAFIAESEKIERKRSQPGNPPRKSHFKEHTDAKSTKSSSPKRASPVAASPPKVPLRPARAQQQNTRQKLRKRKKVDVGTRDPVSPTTKKTPATKVPSNSAAPKTAPIEERRKRPETPLALELPATQVKPAYDGSSYVHKQRMYQQQMSIASFEEQQTVQDANEAAPGSQDEEETEGRGDTAPEMTRPNRYATIHRPPPDHWRDSQSTLFPLTTEDRLPKDTPPQSRKPTLKSNFSPISESTRTAIMGEHPPPSSLGRHPIFAHDSETPNISEPPAGVKSDKILGFRKRPKPVPLQKRKVARRSSKPALFPSCSTRGASFKADEDGEDVH